MTTDIGTFDSVKLGSEDLDRVAAIKAAAVNLETVIRDNVPENRYRSVAMTNLEQAIMWANKGVSRA